MTTSIIAGCISISAADTQPPKWRRILGKSRQFVHRKRSRILAVHERCSGQTTVLEINKSRSACGKESQEQGELVKTEEQDNVLDGVMEVRADGRGRIPWNKGKKLSPLTCEKIRSARLGKKHSLITRRKMSVSHAGKTHTPETMKLLSRKLSRVPKSLEHRNRISASQKKRHAVNKALKAIETAHEAAGPLYNGKDQHLSINLSALSQPISHKPLSREKKTRAEVLNMYKTLLRGYRSLQKELMPWMKAFEAKNSRKPRLADVETTRIAWLISNFKNYILLRDKLLRETPFLKNTMEQAPNLELEPENQSSPLSTSSSSLSFEGLDTRQSQNLTFSLETESMTDDMEQRMQKVSASSDPTKRIRKAMSAALEYKRAQKVLQEQETSSSIKTDLANKAKEIDTLKKMEALQIDSIHISSA